MRNLRNLTETPRRGGFLTAKGKTQYKRGGTCGESREQIRVPSNPERGRTLTVVSPSEGIQTCGGQNRGSRPARPSTTHPSTSLGRGGGRNPNATPVFRHARNLLAGIQAVGQGC